jgi:hypothetical protein
MIRAKSHQLHLSIYPFFNFAFLTEYEHFIPWTVFVVVSFIVILISIIRTISRNWRLLFYFQWRSVVFLSHFILVYFYSCAMIFTIYSRPEKFLTLEDYPNCVGSHPRESSPPCHYTSIDFSFPLMATFVLLACLYPITSVCYVYFTSSFTWKWWKCLLTEGIILREAIEKEQKSDKETFQYIKKDNRTVSDGKQYHKKTGFISENDLSLPNE